jgi:transcriptional regulator with XRE-family HTH domain
VTRPKWANTYAGVTRHSLINLPKYLREARLRRELGTPAAAREIGIGRQTLIRLEAGRGATVPVLVKVFAWLEKKA